MLQFMSRQILGVQLYNILAWFYIYSFFGWIWESLYVSAKNRKWVNRGFVRGPLVTIYGVGAVTVYLVLKPLQGYPVGLYFGGVLTATLLEYVTGVLMEAIFHTNWWDYSDKKFNFQGKICLGSSIAWGFFSLVLFYVLQPFVEWLVTLADIRIGIGLVTAVTVLYAVDFGFAWASAINWRKKLHSLKWNMERFEDFIEKNGLNKSSIRRLRAYPNMSLRLQGRRQRLRDKLEEAIKRGTEKINEKIYRQ